jgi:hypothetical protein
MEIFRIPLSGLALGAAGLIPQPVKNAARAENKIVKTNEFFLPMFFLTTIGELSIRRQYLERAIPKAVKLATLAQRF